MPESPPSADWPAAAPVFAALGDGTRLELVARLSLGQPLSISQLASRSHVTRQAITKHLHVLGEAGLVRCARRGREQIWELEPSQLEKARGYLDRIAGQWETALGRLRDFVEGSAKG